MDAIIRTAEQRDAPEISRIYNHYIEHSYITFETEPVPASEMAERIAETLKKSLPWLVAEVADELAGFAYASKWKGRCAYRHSAESTIYLDPVRTGQGLGRRLYGALLDEMRGLSMRTVIGGVALPNDKSVRLHEHLGFKKVAHFEQVGYKFDRWIDVGYWQRLL